MKEKQAKKELEKRVGGMAQDLLDWYNCTNLDIEDVKKLAALVKEGQFEAWDCPTCGARVQRGNPQDWGGFQGVNQPDYVSYPFGNPRQCDRCRCFHPQK